ncbi:MAG: iron ABC transporter permease [Oscillospiraceae bacterium]|nr:iron ABC transporter permease [Oscillospiraceae bacterium]
MIEKKRYNILLLAIGITLFLFVLAALTMGRYSMNPFDVLRAIHARVTDIPTNDSMEVILFRIRLPRVIASLLVGAALSMSGAVYQSTFRNPLISPDLLRVSSGASMGAVVAIFWGASFQAIPVFAFAGGIMAVLLATSLPKILRNSSNMMLVLSGIVISGFMSSVVGVMMMLSREQDQLSAIVFWQMGSLTRINYSQLVVVTPIFLACITIMILISWRLNILSFGEQEALSVGVNIKRLRWIAIACASLLTASAVSISGTIGWIGLVIPHFGRLLCGSDNTKLLPISALLGGAFLLVIDTIARVATTFELPLSILVGLIGAPFFAWLLHRHKVKII